LNKAKISQLHHENHDSRKKKLINSTINSLNFSIKFIVMGLKKISHRLEEIFAQAHLTAFYPKYVKNMGSQAGWYMPVMPASGRVTSPRTP
jgi:hypothetical protein